MTKTNMVNMLKTDKENKFKNNNKLIQNYYNWVIDIVGILKH